MKLETFNENRQAVNSYLKNGWEIKSEKSEEELDVLRVFLEKKIMTQQQI
ncbi:MAG: hypothetical protein ACWIPH_09240 [Ostreibacterium sp.]